MSRSVDDRVVKMEFDNRRFEQNVQGTLGTLAKLKDGLNFSKSEKALSGLEKTFRNFDVSTFSNNIQSIADRFSTFGIIGDQVIRKLTDAFMGLTGQVTNLVKSMTFDQVAAGWGKYKEKTASVQTIMNATGKSIDEVNGYLEKLMWFSDETSYGFTDMTAALGQLTSAGGDIEKLIPMITGIANATAYAGKGPAEFSRAIYNLNQSYGSGALKYMDWKSLELAGVASKELKQTFIDTAEAMGKIGKGQVTISNFAETLKDNWADTSVMEAAFGKFGQVTEEAYKLVQEGKFDTASDAYASLAGQFDEIYYKAARSAQEAKSFAEVIGATKDAVSSGWMRTFELIFGNYEEAKVLWTDMANSFWEIFASGADSRNELLEKWHGLETGGYADFTEGINNFLESIISAKDMLSEIVHSILPEFKVDNLSSLTTAFKDLSNKAKGFFGGEIEEAPSEFQDIKMATEGLNKEMLKQNLAFRRSQIAYKNAAASGELFRNGMAGIVHVISIARKGFLTLKNSLSPLGNVFSSIGRASLLIFDALGSLFERLDKVVQVSDGFKSSVKVLAESVSNWIAKATNSILGFINSIDFIKGSDGKIKIVSDAFSGLKDKVDSFKNNKAIKDFLDTIKGIKDILSSLGGKALALLTKVPEILPTIGKALSGVGKTLLSITGFIGRVFSKVSDYISSTNILSGIINVLVFAFEKLKKILAPVGEKLKEVFDLLAAGNFEGFKNIMSGLFSGGGLFATLSLASSGKKSIGSFGDLLDGITGILERFKGTDTIAKQILNIGIAIGILAGSLLLLSTVSVDELGTGIAGLSTVFGELIGFLAALKALTGGKGGFRQLSQMSNALTKIAGSMLIFALSLKLLSTMDLSGIGVALLGMGGALAEISGFMMLLKIIAGKKGIKGIKEIASAIKTMATSMIILALAMKIFATMDWEGIGKGLSGMGGALFIIAGFIAAISVIQKFMGKIGWLAIAASILIIANAMLVLSGAIALLSLIPWEGLGKAAAAIGGFFAILTIFGAVAQKNVLGLIVGSAAMLAIVPALVMFAGAMAIFGTMSIDMIGRALLALGGGLVEISVGMMFMAKALPGAVALLIASAALMAFAPAMALLGSMPLANIGKALLSLAGVFVILFAGSILLGPVTPIILGLSVALLAFGSAVLLAGAGFALLATGLSLVAGSGVIAAAALVESLKVIIIGIGNLAIDIVESVAKIIGALVDALVLSIPKIVEGIGVILLAVLEFLAKNIKPIADFIFDILIALLDIISKRLPELIDAAYRLIISFINGVAEALRKNTEAIIAAFKNLFSAIIEFALSVLAELVRGIPGVGEAIANKITGWKDDVRKKLAPEETKKIGQGAMTGLSSGINEAKPSLFSAGVGISDSVKGGLSSKMFDFKELGGNYTLGFADGLLSKKNAVSSASAVIARTAVNQTKTTLQIKSPSRVAAQLGMYWDLGLAEGLYKHSKDIELAAKKVATTPLESMSNAISNIGSLMDGEITDPVIRPIMDLSSVEDGANRIGNLIGNQNKRISSVYGDGSIVNPNGNTTTTNYGGFTINVTAAPGEDVRSLAKRLMAEIQEEALRKGAATIA